MKDFTLVDKLTFFLTVLGAFDWALIGIFRFNLITWLFGRVPPLAMGVCVAVGISAVYFAFSFLKKCNK